VGTSTRRPFEGYGDLAELRREGYRKQYGDIRRLDQILEAEGDTRQPLPGVRAGRRLMLGHFLPPIELRCLRIRLGHPLGVFEARECILPHSQ
jgi:hypothetical protein